MRSMSVGRLLQSYVRTQLGYTCTCCGSGVGFGEFGSNPREAGPCLSCGASNRNRQMAHIVRKEFGLGESAPLRLPDEVVVYNTESTGAVHAQLKNSGQYIFSEYFGHEFKGGELVNGVRHEDLQNLSFQDQTLDLVLSSDVMEHMPDPYRAHSEIFRALKPGGKHIFTVPYDPGSPTDDCRAVLQGDEVRLLKPALYHGDPVRPDEGVLVWFIFGREMSQKLQAIGFEVQTLMLHAPKKGIIGEGAIVFVATKITGCPT
jgi:SAM-dependent methyltransferase